MRIVRVPGGASKLIAMGHTWCDQHAPSADGGSARLRLRLWLPMRGDPRRGARRKKVRLRTSLHVVMCDHHSDARDNVRTPPN